MDHEYQNTSHRLILRTYQKGVGDPVREVVRWLLIYRYSKSDVTSIQIAVNQALDNAMKHGNRSDSGKKVIMEYSVTPIEFKILITDEGSGFSHQVERDSASDSELAIAKTGRGLALMRRHMTDVRFNSKGNQVEMLKCKSPTLFYL